MPDDSHPRDSFRYVLHVAFVIGLGAIASAIGAIGDSKNYIARAAIANVADVEKVLKVSNLELEGSVIFAALVWFLGLISFSLALFLYFRNERLTALSTKLNGANARIRGLGEQLGAASQEVETLKAERTELLLEAERLKTPSAEALAIEAQYAKAILAISDIVRGHGYANAKFKFTRITETTTVAADGTAYVERDYDVEAGAEEARSWRFQIFADDSAEPVKFLTGLDFRARQVAERPGEALRYLLHHDERLKKELTLFFIPPLQPNESRRFRLAYRWPKFAGDLIRVGATTFFVNYRTAEAADTAEVAYEIRFAKALGDLSCRLVSAPQGGRLVPDHDDEHWVWRYENAAMAMSGARLELRVQKQVAPRAD